MEASHLSKCEMSSSSNRHLEIIWKRAYEYHPQYEKRLVNVFESKEQSGIKLTKEIICRNVKCHLAILIWKSFFKVRLKISSTI